MRFSLLREVISNFLLKEDSYRGTDYGDISKPKLFEYERIWKEYFDDAKFGLGMDNISASRYADEQTSDDWINHEKEVKLYKLKTQPSFRRRRTHYF